MSKAPGKREARKQDRRDAILAVAKESFLEKGYAGTSMSAISAELGGSKGTLWSYFPSKEELFSAVLDHATASYRQQLADVLKPSPDVRATLLQFCRGFLTKIVSPEALKLHRLVAAETGRSPEVGQIFFRRAPQPTQKLLCEFLESRMAAGQLRRDDPLLAARALSGLCLGGLHQRMVWGQAEASEEEIETEARNVVELFLRAFGPVGSA